MFLSSSVYFASSKHLLCRGCNLWIDFDVSFLQAADKSPLPSKSSPSYEENAKKERQPMSEENAKKEQQPMSEENAEKEQQRMSEENSKIEQQRIEELLRSKGMKRGLYPRISVANKGQKVSAFTYYGKLYGLKYGLCSGW